MAFILLRWCGQQLKRKVVTWIAVCFAVSVYNC